jgi:flavin-binding protein dodecin
VICGWRNDNVIDRAQTATGREVRLAESFGMTDQVDVIEVVGLSTNGVGAAFGNTVDRASETARGVDRLEVVAMQGDIVAGALDNRQLPVKNGFWIQAAIRCRLPRSDDLRRRNYLRQYCFQHAYSVRQSSRPSPRLPGRRMKGVASLIMALTVFFGGPLIMAPLAWGGLAPPELVYLYDVTFRRPDLHWASADAALAYGYGICNKITEGRPYAQIARDFKADFQTSDESLASYVISDAAQNLCPELIWQLRNSAANYTPPPAQ